MVARSGGLQLSGLLPRRTGLRHAPLDRPHRRTARRPPCPLVPAWIFRMTIAFAEVGARTNFTLLDGASHPAEMVATAAVLGHAGIGVCDTNSLAGVVRAHVAAKDVGIRFIVGTRLLLDDGASYLAWPADPLYVARPHARTERRMPTHPHRIARPCGRLGDGGHPARLAGCRLCR